MIGHWEVLIVHFRDSVCSKMSLLKKYNLGVLSPQIREATGPFFRGVKVLNIPGQQLQCYPEDTGPR